VGQHNLSNALAAVAVGRLGLDFPVIAKSIATFEGASRRFEFRGEANGIVFIDDYAHHLTSSAPHSVQHVYKQNRKLGSLPSSNHIAIAAHLPFIRLCSVLQPCGFGRCQ